MSNNPVVILGGGMTGLSLAYYLHKIGGPVLNGRKIIVLEGSKQLGGWLKTNTFADGVIHELGPRSVRFAPKLGINTMNMIEDIGLRDDVVGVPVTSLAASKRCIWANGQMHVLPNNLGGMLFKQKPFTKSLVNWAWREMFTPPLKLAEGEDISVYNFVEQRFGEEVARYFADPMCRGITAGDARKLSMRALFPEVFDKALIAGSVTKGLLQKVPYAPNNHVKVVPGALAKEGAAQKWAMWNLHGGLQKFPEALSTYLTKLEGSPVYIHNQSKVESVEFNNSDEMPATVTVSTPTEKITIDADHVFSALPAHDLADVLMPSQSIISNQLKQIRPVNVAVVCLEYEGKKVVSPDSGFGFLVPSFEKQTKILGITFDSNSFPSHDGGRNITRITCMMGGEWFEEHFGNVDDNIKDTSKVILAAIEGAKVHLGFKKNPVRVLAAVHKNCISQYQLNHRKLVSNIRSDIIAMNLPLELSGASYDGVAVNECIFYARRTVQEMVESNETAKAGLRRKELAV